MCMFLKQKNMERSYSDSTLPISIKEEMVISRCKVVLIYQVFYVEFGNRPWPHTIVNGPAI